MPSGGSRGGGRSRGKGGRNGKNRMSKLNATQDIAYESQEIEFDLGLNDLEADDIKPKGKKRVKCSLCGQKFGSLASHSRWCDGDAGKLLEKRRKLQNAVSEEGMMVDSEDVPGVDMVENEPHVQIQETIQIPSLSQSTRPRRKHRMPARYTDFVVGTQNAMNDIPIPANSPRVHDQFSPSSSHLSPEHENSHSPAPISEPIFLSEPNNASLFRIHRYFSPQNDPYISMTLADTSDISSGETDRSRSDVFGRNATDTVASNDNHSLFPNPTLHRLMKWHYDSSRSKSLKSLDRLVKDVFLQPDFDVEHLHDFSARATAALLDKPFGEGPESTGVPFKHFDGWINGSVQIKLVRARNHVEESEAPTVDINKVYYRRLFDVIRAEMKEPYTAQFFLKPFMLFWQPSNRPLQRVYGEAYTSDRMLEFEAEIMAKIQNLPKGTIQHEVGIVAIALYSDSTLLSNFGKASMWPAYFTFSNWSKYPRLKLESHAMNHIVYFPSLPATINEHYETHFASIAQDAELRFCKVELLQAIWHLLVSDPEFYDAYVNGYVEECADGIMRHLFYRFFCYSADYVEKVMLACIKFLAQHPCPLCLLKKEDMHRLGTKADMKTHETLAREDSDDLRKAIKKARQLIFDHGYSVSSRRVQDLLGKYSAQPIQSAFSKLYQPHGLNHFLMYPPDQFHDNTGRSSDYQKHNVRILQATNKSHVEYLNWRYRQVPTFGNGTIRRFKKDVAKFSKFAGRDYEDALQCAMPCYEGLFPDELDPLIQDLTFTFATYISYSSLRQHTDSTLATFKTVTKELGRSFREYVRAVTDIDTRENDKEVESRIKRNPDGGTEPRKKCFSLTNYKTHALGHQIDAIRYWGTADGTNTQAGEREHHRVKQLYGVTNKHDFEGQIGKHVMRQQRLHWEAARTSARVPEKLKPEEMPPDDPSAHHHIPLSEKNPMRFDVLLQPGLPPKPGLQNFKQKLQRHLLSQILDVDPEGCPDHELYKVVFVGNRFFRHQKFRVNYTSYDLRRKQDTIGFRRRPHIMLLADNPDASHPYLYARVIGIYHANVIWFQLDESYPWGWRAKRLPRLQFLDEHDPDAFGFADPTDVIRASHLIPAFHYNTTQALLSEGSLVRLYEEYYDGKYVKEDEDWVYHYVNFFPDRDMFMRYRGGGIGHATTDRYTRRLEEEATQNDEALPTYDSSGIRIHWQDDDNYDEEGKESDLEDIDSEDFLDSLSQRMVGDNDSNDDLDIEKDEANSESSDSSSNGEESTDEDYD
ncbi:hypothetical protein E1B28_006921 [Marasmius oreades]|uniref:Uncharacterized protein n=1 Tax=Marasmius oreades TaxID=181124 RepID=A0A9P7S197_9AGAR|nr:uncharacterized protein E1B28_006921 [Marasmius oreades]KAG7093235.1 hypothetical protein E1B28_006921 [Marasmius oreades]